MSQASSKSYYLKCIPLRPLMVSFTVILTTYTAHAHTNADRRFLRDLFDYPSTSDSASIYGLGFALVTAPWLVTWAVGWLIEALHVINSKGN